MTLQIMGALHLLRVLTVQSYQKMEEVQVMQIFWENLHLTLGTLFFVKHPESGAVNVLVNSCKGCCCIFCFYEH